MYTTHHPPRRARRTLATLAAVGIMLTTVGTAAGTANALAPANDNYADRITITKDTTVDINFADATLEPADSEGLLATCGIDFTGFFPTMQTVWYDFTPTVTETVEISVVGDGGGFFGGASAVTGEPGSFVGASHCADEVFDVTAGVTYHLGVADVQGLSSIAHLTIATAPPPPTASITVSPSGTVDQTTNTITFNGTYTCTSGAPATFVIQGDAQQTNGRLFLTSYVTGDTFTAICDGTPHTWASSNLPFNTTGLFRPGQVTLKASITVCNGRCVAAEAPPATVRLRSVKPAVAPPPPPPVASSVKVTIDPALILDVSTNAVTVSGTVSCTGGDEAFLSGRVRQVSTGSLFVNAFVYGADLGACDGVTHRWTTTAVVNLFGFLPDLLSHGPATFIGESYTCTFDACSNFVSVDASFKLKAVSKPSNQSPFAGQLPPGVVLNLDRRARLDTATNTATVTGTISCTGTGDDSLTVDFDELAQLVGNVHVRSLGQPFLTIPCDNLPHSISLDAVGLNGRYAGGKAVMSVAVYAVRTVPGGGTDFSFGTDSRDVKLVPTKATK